MNFLLLVIGVLMLIFARPVLKILYIILKMKQLELKELEKENGNLMAGEKDVC